MYQSIREQIERLRRELKNPVSFTPLMKQIGALGVAASQKAFREQALGDLKWPVRYPSQQEPKLNIAGVLQDFKSGRTAPKPNRFQDRPALIDEGQRGGMWGSLTLEVTGPLSVSWGTNKEYARIQQEGGGVTIRYDDATKKRMSEWLFNPSGTVRTAKVNGTDQTRKDYLIHMGPLLKKNSFRQRIIPRPFVGITDELQRDINATIKAYYVKVQKRT